MKRILLILLFAATTFAVGAASYVGFSAGAFSAWQIDNYEPTRPLFGGGADVTLHYHLVHGHFLFDTGVGISFDRTVFSLPNQTVSIKAFTNLGTEYSLVSNIKDRKDAANSTYLQVPLMFGGEFGNYYFLVGAKFNLNIWGNTQQRALYDTKAVFDRYYEPFVDMPQHGLHDFNPTTSLGSLRYKYDVLACIEAGWTFNFGSAQAGTSRQKLRVGLFFQAGMLNINKSDGTAALTETRLDNEQLRLVLNHVVRTADMSESWLRNMNVGIRLTYLLNVRFNRRKPCKCQE